MWLSTNYVKSKVLYCVWSTGKKLYQHINSYVKSLKLNGNKYTSTKGIV